MDKILKEILLTPNQLGLGSFFFVINLICVVSYVIFLIVISIKKITLSTKIKFMGVGFSLLLFLMFALVLDNQYSWQEKSALIFLYLGVFSAMFTLSILINAKNCRNNKPNEDILKWQYPESAVSKQVKVDENKNCTNEVDFFHVKNVIERLKHYPLSMAEKKQTASLGALIEWVEREGAQDERREEINEKLSELLKIMAKYSV